MAGHLLECGSQVTRRLLRRPRLQGRARLCRRGLPDRWRCMPTAASSSARPDGTGGCVTLATVTEQLLYEVHDPAAYLTPDVTADITGGRVSALGPGSRGGSRRARPRTAADPQGDGCSTRAAGSRRARSPTRGPTRQRARGSPPRSSRTACGSGWARCRCGADLIGVASVFADDAGRFSPHTARPTRRTCACACRPRPRIGRTAERSRGKCSRSTPAARPAAAACAPA